MSIATAAWVAAGHPLETGFADALDDPNDVRYRPYDLDGPVEDAMHAYLSWEVDLVQQLARDDTTDFKTYPET